MYASAFGVKVLLFVSSKPWSETVTARICPISSDSTDNTPLIPVVLPIEEIVGRLSSKTPWLIISIEFIPPCILVDSEV